MVEALQTAAVEATGAGHEVEIVVGFAPDLVELERWARIDAETQRSSADRAAAKAWPAIEARRAQ